MAKVYLETSFFSACVSKRTTPKAITWRETSLEWWENQRIAHDLFISAEVVAELANPAFSEGAAALQMVNGLNIAEFTQEARGLAALLVSEKVMPGPAGSGDAVHVAVATAYRMDYLLTWNARHLANPNKKTHFGMICLRFGFCPPQIVTPDLL